MGAAPAAAIVAALLFCALQGPSTLTSPRPGIAQGAPIGREVVKSGTRPVCPPVVWRVGARRPPHRHRRALCLRQPTRHPPTGFLRAPQRHRRDRDAEPGAAVSSSRSPPSRSMTTGDPGSFSHDVAILTLNGRLTFSSQIQLDRARRARAGRTPCPARARPSPAGARPRWGPTHTRCAGRMSRSSATRLRTEVPGLDGPAMTCAGDSTNDACFGDSGSALVVPSATNWSPRMLGIVSSARRAAAHRRLPPAFTRRSRRRTSTITRRSHPMSTADGLAASSPAPRVAARDLRTPAPAGLAVSATSSSFHGERRRGARTAQARNTYDQAADAGSPRVQREGAGTPAGCLRRSAAVTVRPRAAAAAVAAAERRTSQALGHRRRSRASRKTTCTATRCTLSVSVTSTPASRPGSRPCSRHLRSSYRGRCKPRAAEDDRL